MKYLLMTLLMLSVTSNAEIVNFECTYGSTSSPISHSVDMTNKTWEKTEHGTTEIFEDVVASSNSISVQGQYTAYSMPTRDTHVISRVDLSYSYKFELFSEILGGWQTPSLFVGQCKIVEAPPVEKAF